MNRSLTLGEALLISVARSYLIEKGKETYLKIKETALRLALPRETVSIIEKYETEYGIKDLVLNDLLTADPWSPVVEKLLGHRLPKKGMSAYFAYYVQSLGSVCALEKIHQETAEKFRKVKEGRDKIDAYLSFFTEQYTCEVEDLPEAMGMKHGSVSTAENIRAALEMIADADKMTTEVKKETEDVFNLAYTLFARLGILEDMVKRPKKANARAIALFLMQRAMNFATQSDFEKVKKEAESFLSSPDNIRRIILLNQGRQI